MSAVSRKAYKQHRSETQEGTAIKACLEYLHGEAVKNDYHMAAHLIGAAMESIAEEIARSNPRNAYPRHLTAAH